MAFSSIHTAFIRKSLRTGSLEQARRLIEKLPVADLKHLVVRLSPADLRRVAEMLLHPASSAYDPARAAELCAALEPPVLYLLTNGLEDEQLVEIIDGLEHNDAARLLHALPKERRGPLLAHTRGQRRADLVSRLRSEVDRLRNRSHGMSLHAFLPVVVFLGLLVTGCSTPLAVKSTAIGGAPGAVADPNSDIYYMKLDFTAPTSADNLKFTLLDANGATIREWVRGPGEKNPQQVELKIDQMKGEPVPKGAYKLRIDVLGEDSQPTETVFHNFELK